MYAVRINSDNTVKTIVNQRIWRGYKLSDWFWFFTKIYDKNNMSKYSASIEFTLPKSKKVVIEKLIAKDELYNGHLKYTLLPNSQITKEVGKVKAKVIFSKKGDTPDKEIVKILETSEFTIPISTRKKWHNDTDLTYNNSNGHCCNCGNNNNGNTDSSDNINTGGNSSGNTGNSGNNNTGNCDCNSEEHIAEILSRTKPLVFESINAAEIELNSGNINNIYYGQTILINENNKYISYTVQKGTNGYIVEPIDTVCDGPVWEEDV